MTSSLDWLSLPVARPNDDARHAAEARQRTLTKPPGALGRLETLAIHLAALQGTLRPLAERVQITVFAGDHGVAAEGVSAFPQSVTGEMLRNFARGGAAVNVLAHALGAALEVVDLGTVNDPGPLDNVLSRRLGAGTANFAQGTAMSAAQLAAALDAGRKAAIRSRDPGAHLFIGGEMGIGNSTSAAAMVCVLLDAVPEQIAGPGTGLDADGVRRKVAVVRRALQLHSGHLFSPLEALRRLGGFEIAALAGCYIACAQVGVPALVDGFIASSAALVAVRIVPGTEDWLIFSHASAEPGHRAILAALDAKPILDLGLRLGEGSGAAVSVPILRLACALHNGMATFTEADVSEKSA